MQVFPQLFEFSQSPGLTYPLRARLRIRQQALPIFHEYFYKDSNLISLIIKVKILFACGIIMSTACASSVFLSSFSINLLAFYHKWCSLIGYVTHYLFCDR